MPFAIPGVIVVFILIIIIIEKLVGLIGLKFQYVDGFIQRHYPHLWDDSHHI